MLKFFQRISLIHIVLLSVMLNLVMYCVIRSWKPDIEKNTIITSDATGYETLAENILRYHTFAGKYDTNKIPLSSPLLEPVNLLYNYDTFRGPGYPAFLAMVYFIAGVKPFAAIFLQILLNIISVILAYRITLLLFSNTIVATLTGLLYAMDVHSIYVANVLYSDTLFIFLFLLSVYYFISGIQEKSLPKFLTSAVFIGLSCLTRPVSLLFPIVYVMMVFIFYRNLGRWIIKALALFMVIAYSIIGTWAFRNHTMYGSWQLTTEDKYGLLMFYEAFGEARQSNLPIDSVRERLQAECNLSGCNKLKNPFDRSKICGQVAWKHIRQNKLVFAETQLWGATHMFLSLGNIDMAQTLGWASSNVDGQLIMDSQRIGQNFSHAGQAFLGILIIAVLIVQYIGFLCGMFYLVKNHKYLIITFSILTILYFTLITGAVGKYRYKLPMEFVICSIAGYGWYSVFKANQKQGYNP